MDELEDSMKVEEESFDDDDNVEEISDLHLLTLGLVDFQCYL